MGNSSSLSKPRESFGPSGYEVPGAPKSPSVKPWSRPFRSDITQMTSSVKVQLLVSGWLVPGLGVLKKIMWLLTVSPGTRGANSGSHFRSVLSAGMMTP